MRTATSKITRAWKKIFCAIVLLVSNAHFNNINAIVITSIPSNPHKIYLPFVINSDEVYIARVEEVSDYVSTNGPYSASYLVGLVESKRSFYDVKISTKIHFTPSSSSSISNAVTQTIFITTPVYFEGTLSGATNLFTVPLPFVREDAPGCGFYFCGTASYETEVLSWTTSSSINYINVDAEIVDVRLIPEEFCLCDRGAYVTTTVQNKNDFPIYNVRSVMWDRPYQYVDVHEESYAVLVPHQVITTTYYFERWRVPYYDPPLILAQGQLTPLP